MLLLGRGTGLEVKLTKVTQLITEEPGSELQVPAGPKVWPLDHWGFQDKPNRQTLRSVFMDKSVPETYSII